MSHPWRTLKFMASPRVRGYALALLLWLGLGLALCVLWGNSAAGRVRASFEQDVRILHRVLSQRAEQHDAVLAGLVALERAGVGTPTLASFAESMRSQYPQVGALERCTGTQQVGCALLAGVGFDPPDGLQETVLEALGQASTARPRVLSSTVPVFALVQSDGGETAFVLWIDAARFAALSEFTQPDSGFSLSGAGGGRVFYRLEPSRTASALEASLLPRFSLQKPLGSASQPFGLEAARQLRFADLPLGGMALLLAAGAVLTLLLTRFLFGVRQARLERLAAQQALQRERARAEGTVKAVSDALLTWDLGGRVTLANPAAGALLGCEAASLVGRPLTQVLRLQATLGQQPLLGYLDSFWRNPVPTELPEGTTLLDVRGQARLVEGSLSPLTDEQGRVTGGVLTLRDLGPFRKRMLEALEHSERRLREHEALLAHAGRMGTLSEIAAGIAHELNQPLTAILGHAQASLRLLEEEDADLERVRRSLQSSADQARRAAQILERLRAHVARQPLRREPVDLRQVVESVRVLTEHELRERGVRLETELGGEGLEVLGDAIQIEQVLHNLLRNALEALGGVEPERRRVRVRAWREGREVRLEVRDFGPGIAPEVLPQLFNPFVSSKAGGMGLGLSLSQTLVQGMGGVLEGGNAPGGGACFTLRLPARVTEEHVRP